MPHTFTYATQPLSLPPTGHLLHVVTDISFAAGSSASCGDILTCLVAQALTQTPSLRLSTRFIYRFLSFCSSLQGGPI